VIAQYTSQTTTSSHVNLAALLPFLFLYLGLIVLMVVAWVKVVTKAGYSGWWVLVGLIPCVGFIMFLVFAFSRWPVLDQVRTAPTAYPGYGPGPTGYVPPTGPAPYIPPAAPPPPPPQDWPPRNPMG
jgi:hypothetical protein